MLPKIDSFRGEYRWLSNFHMCTIERNGIIFPSTEHAYQAAKTNDLQIQSFIAGIKTPGQAMRTGRALEGQGKQRSDWLAVRVQIMRDVNFYKYMMHAELRYKLICTGDSELIEGNTWGDKFWGVCGGEGENQLGKVLMCVRESLRLLNT